MRKRALGQRREVVQADGPECLDEDGRIGAWIFDSSWKPDSLLFGVRDQTGYRSLSQTADGSAQELGVQGPFGHGLRLDVGPGRGVCGFVAGENRLEGAGGRVVCAEWRAEVPVLAERGDISDVCRYSSLNTEPGSTQGETMIAGTR